MPLPRFCTIGFAALISFWLPSMAVELVRVPNTTLRLPASPGSYGYRFGPTFPNLTFNNGVALATPPGETNRLFVVERLGRVAVITNLALPTRSVFLDIASRVRLDNFNEMGLLGLTFHPDYATNGRFFLFYTTTASTPGAANQRHNRLSEFRVSAGNPNQADATSERILLQQRDDAVNHNGGDLHFGPDGYLYVALGDEGGANDAFNNSQRLTNDFFAGVLRLDVDKRPGSLPPNPHPSITTNFAVPRDNPFVGTTHFLGRAVDPAKVRTEFWAVGLRNPWRMSFDVATGELWIGDVGQDAREMVFVSRTGANHGWAFREGELTGPLRGAPADFRTNPVHNYSAPLWTYPHQQGLNGGFSITGGFVYRGSRLSQLHGAYICSDYVTGNVWALRRTPGTNKPSVTHLTGARSIAAFAPDPRNGDVLAMVHEIGHILRLEYNESFKGEPLPDRLSDTGAFSDLASFTPQPGIVPYEVNLSFWSDGAFKRRWFSIPDTNQFATFNESGPWSTPPGTIWIKHFELELEEGVAETRRRLETRFLVRNNNGVYGVTYRWNEAQTDATLVGESGEDEAIAVIDAQGGIQTRLWRYPGRTECLVCHNHAAGGSLSFNAHQLHREFGHGGLTGPQVASLSRAGYFTPETTKTTSALPYAPPSDESTSLSWRARSWLAVNCGYCHQPGGLGGAQFDARAETPTALTRMIFGPLNNSAETNRAVVVPGRPDLSELHRRLVRRGIGQMPPIATTVVDSEGARLIARWIEEAAAEDVFETWRRKYFPDLSSSDAAESADPDADGIPNIDEHTLNTSPIVSSAGLKASVTRMADGKIRFRVPHPANRRLTLESSANPAGPWATADARFTPYPSREETLEFEVPLSDGTGFYRVRVALP